MSRNSCLQPLEREILPFGISRRGKLSSSSQFRSSAQWIHPPDTTPPSSSSWTVQRWGSAVRDRTVMLHQEFLRIRCLRQKNTNEGRISPRRGLLARTLERCTISKRVWSWLRNDFVRDYTIPSILLYINKDFFMCFHNLNRNSPECKIYGNNYHRLSFLWRHNNE